ncbi:hypothetical protein MMC29_005899 [Sticta canariensis]|nr:hypothetical protein [Sticta canariensis]
MTSILDKSSNLSLYSIPVVWLISLFPALYVGQLASNKFDNSQPRNSVGKLVNDQSIDSRTKARIARAHGAQLNGFENIGLYAAAVVAGNMAGLDSTTLNYLSGGYVVSRIAYNLVYINAETPRAANLRTGVFLSGVGCVMTLFIKAGGVLQEGVRVVGVGR